MATSTPMICVVCGATAFETLPAPPDSGGWEVALPAGGYERVRFTPIPLCAQHAETPIGVCRCAGRYGASGSYCRICGQRRVFLVRGRPRGS